MKKILALLLAALFVLALTACSADPLYTSTDADNEAATGASEASPAVSKDDYPDSFQGLQNYLIDSGLLSDKDNDKVETYAELLGAENGVRYTLSSTAFIEFYEYTDTTSALAKNVLDQVAADGTFELVGLDPLTGVLSDSGKYMAVYNADLSYDYDAILSPFKKW